MFFQIPIAEKLPPKIEGLVSCGPWGGSGGAQFDDGVYTGIRQVNVSRNVGIVSIKALYDWNGEAVWGSKHGGTGGYRTEKVKNKQNPYLAQPFLLIPLMLFFHVITGGV